MLKLFWLKLDTVSSMIEPTLNFQAFIEERDRCCDRDYVSPHSILREGYFCNTDRMKDRVSKELAFAVGVNPKLRKEAIATVIALRMAGSPRQSEKPGYSGSYAIMQRAVRSHKIFEPLKWLLEGRHVKKLSFKKYIETMPFSGRKTYHAVVSKMELARAVPKIAKRVAKRTKASSLHSLHARLMRYWKKYTACQRNLEFHSL